MLTEAFGALAAHAEAEGVVIALEPLNRYEDHMVNTLGQAVALCERIGSPALGVAADTYHMNIEEADPLEALVAAGPVDPARPAQRQQPAGAGGRPPGLDRAAGRHLVDRLRATSSRTSAGCPGPVDEVLPVSVRRMRQAAWS